MSQQQPARQQPNQIRLEMPGNLTSIYANAAVVTQTHSEIVMDFVQVMPNDPRARIQARIIMTPANAKMFLKALNENLERFEGKHGEINLPPLPPTLAEQLFGTFKPSEDNPNPSPPPRESGPDGSV